MTSRSLRPWPVVVLGLMGAGKTGVATAVGAALGWPVSDSDVWITAATGRTAAEIVAAGSRGDLHRWETRHLFDGVSSPTPVVVAAAASVVDTPDARAVLSAVPVLWLDASPAVLARRFASSAHRPRYDPDVLAMLTEMHARRSEVFAGLATWRVDADRPVEEVLALATRLVAGHTADPGATDSVGAGAAGHHGRALLTCDPSGRRP